MILGVEAALEASLAWKAEATMGVGEVRLLTTEATHLERLPKGPARWLYLALIGPESSEGREGASHPAQRYAILREPRRLEAVVRAMTGRARAASSLDGMWRETTSSPSPDAVAAATALLVGGVLPLALSSADAVVAVPEPSARALMALLVGRAAGAGDIGARGVARDILSVRSSIDLHVSVVKGLGGGLWRAGLARVASETRVASFDRPAWTRACRNVAILAAHTESEIAEPLLTMALAVRDVAACDEALSATLERAPARLQRALIESLVRVIPTLGREARVAVVTAALDRGLLEPDALARERDAEVLLRVLERVDGLRGSRWSRARAELFRDLAGHPDPAVRGAVARRMMDEGELAPSAEVVAGAELVALPATNLARTPLDRLRAALFLGESDDLLEIADGIPLASRPAARRALLAAVEVPNAALRRACVEALAVVGDPGDGPEILRIARRYRALEGTVAAALRRLSATNCADELATLYRRRLKWADDEAVDDYCALAGPERVGHLLEALDTRYYPGARAGAARALARIGAHEVVFALRSRGLSDTHDSARRAALSALFELTASAPSPDELAGYALLFRPAESLREGVERAREAGRAALPGLRRTLAKGSWRRRRAACDALSAIPGAEAEEVLLGALVDPDEDVRLMAMEALMERGWQPSTPHEITLAAVAARRTEALLEHVEHIDLGVLVENLRLGGHVFRAELLDVLERVPGWRPSPEQRASIAVARLDGESALTEPGGLEAVLEGLDHTWQANPHRARLTRALFGVEPARIARALKDEAWGWRAREALCHALGRPGDDTGVDALAARVLDEDDDVRRAALEALSRVGTPRAAQAVAEGFASPFQEDREIVALVLASFGDVALPVLRALIDDAWWEGRQGAAMTLRGWHGDRQTAADLLVVLAVDAEYRVSQPAREGLERHGVLPHKEGIRAAVERAQSLTIEGLETWLGMAWVGAPDPDMASCIDRLMEHVTEDELPFRLGLVSLFRVEHLALWLEDAAMGRTTDHVSVRLAAAEALRALILRQCPICRGEGAVRCPECSGSGERPCGTCGGQMLVTVPCTEIECTARQTTRRIDSRRCPTCRGRGAVLQACDCAEASGRVACALCEGRGRIQCVTCAGSGAGTAVAQGRAAEP